jgi:hypothetical protein
MAGYRLFLPSVGRAFLKCDNVTGLQSLAHSENQHYSKPVANLVTIDPDRNMKNAVHS